MPVRRPHFLLHSQAELAGSSRGWSFKLRPVDGGGPITATEREHDATPERLELLAVVRGLEAVPEPSRVTLLTASDVVQRGIRYGLEEWRADDWHWESFGEMVPVRNLDLWRRIDRALQFHQVDVRRFRVDPAHETNEAPDEAPNSRATPPDRNAAQSIQRSTVDRPHASFGERVSNAGGSAATTAVLERPTMVRTRAAPQPTYVLDEEIDFRPIADDADVATSNIRSSRFRRAPRRQLRVWRLHIHRRLGELLESLRWFAETTGVSQVRLPWLETPLER